MMQIVYHAGRATELTSALGARCTRRLTTRVRLELPPSHGARRLGRVSDLVDHDRPASIPRVQNRSRDRVGHARSAAISCGGV